MFSRVLNALLLGLILLLTGCAAEDGPSDKPSGTAIASPTASASDDGSSTGATPSVEPATGHRVESRSIVYHLPDRVRWKLGRNGQSANYRDEAGNRWSVQHVDNLLQAGDSGSLDEDWGYARDAIYNPGVHYRRGENRVVGGVEGWTASAVDKTFDEYLYVFGGVHDRLSASLLFIGPDKDPRTREWIDAVLASVEWK